MINVKSEIMPLKRVLLHRPGNELLNLTPDSLQRLLFDDIPYLKIAREECKKDLMTFLDKGIALRKEESEAQNKIEETFFFYPIKGVLNAISSAIYESLTNK
jgi:arginine deiminase